MKTLATSLSIALFASACGDNTPSAGDPDANPTAADAPLVDAAVDAATIDAAPFVAPTPIVLPLSAAGPDQLQSVIAAPGGGFYAAGYAAATVSGDRTVVVLKFDAEGALDTSFGIEGTATTTLVHRGGAGEIDVVVQSDGGIIVSATVANLVNASDRDMAVTRVTSAGLVDVTFGLAGVRVLDLGTAVDVGGTLTGLDAVRNLALDSADRIYVYGQTRGEDPRTDTDFVVTRLGPSGGVNTAFGTDGSFALDLTGGVPAASLNATPRGLTVLANGNVLASGYTSNPSFSTGPQGVMFMLDDAGDLVPGFAEGGVWHDLVLAIQTEIYKVAVDGNRLVTAGYGRAAGETNDWVSLAFDATTGVRDTTWGGADLGAVLIDPLGTMVGDNCRGALALPDGKTLLYGSAGPANMPSQDAAYAVLTATGTRDSGYSADGVITEDEGGNDQIWGAAVSGDVVMMVGLRGGGSTQTDVLNDDALLIVLPIQ